ncbi:hypothetical protein THIOM_002401 [Candidatus Thiomargarita nelsonii]|uniref:Uncharacterized protein n=1 Tax=Candidatus Thiomargarita nelsonii TaxID=1003181 RepID=A0A176S1K9_9GAMM|nr:hypothetical protein THIOM_002401 [Candidatus Thiomargarita nelsonii]
MHSSTLRVEYFLITQITPRIRRPKITSQLMCPHTSVTTTNVLIMAFSAATFERARSLFKSCHQRL